MKYIFLTKNTLILSHVNSLDYAGFSEFSDSLMQKPDILCSLLAQSAGIKARAYLRCLLTAHICACNIVDRQSTCLGQQVQFVRIIQLPYRHAIRSSIVPPNCDNDIIGLHVRLSFSPLFFIQFSMLSSRAIF